MQDKVIDVFSRHKPNICKYLETGYSMISDINSTNPDLVVDLGCGSNMYKSHIHNLIGIDIVSGGDLQCDISNLPFSDNTADVVLALGSINFGTRFLIEKQLKELHRILKPGGIAWMRVLGKSYNNYSDPNNIYFDWTKQEVEYYTKKIGFSLTSTVDYIFKQPNEIMEIRHQKIGDRGDARLFWKWKK